MTFMRSEFGSNINFNFELDVKIKFDHFLGVNVEVKLESLVPNGGLLRLIGKIRRQKKIGSYQYLLCGLSQDTVKPKPRFLQQHAVYGE